MKPALLVIDMQQTFFDSIPAARESLESALEPINAAVRLFREKGLPVIVIEDIEEANGRLPGSPGFETTERIHLIPEDPRIHKTYSNAFNKTGLEQVLRGLEVDTLLLTGFAATRCVLSTCRGAQDLDFRPLMLRGALADRSPEKVRFVEDLEELISFGALTAFFELL